MLKKLIRWIVFPGTPHSRERGKLLRAVERELPDVVRYCEEEPTQDGDREEVMDVVISYREAYRQAQSSDAAGFTLGQADRFKNAEAERYIVRLENVFGGFE